LHKNPFYKKQFSVLKTAIDVCLSSGYIYDFGNKIQKYLIKCFTKREFLLSYRVYNVRTTDIMIVFGWFFGYVRSN